MVERIMNLFGKGAGKKEPASAPDPEPKKASEPVLEKMPLRINDSLDLPWLFVKGHIIETNVSRGNMELAIRNGKLFIDGCRVILLPIAGNQRFTFIRGSDAFKEVAGKISLSSSLLNVNVLYNIIEEGYIPQDWFDKVVFFFGTVCTDKEGKKKFIPWTRWRNVGKPRIQFASASDNNSWPRKCSYVAVLGPAELDV